ncbi:MAG: PilZ domain-containing protein [Betaproteobacteria bacterium]|nr:PilZ domain-containing protein [Betaproteobacteria bacterium]
MAMGIPVSNKRARHESSGRRLIVAHRAGIAPERRRRTAAALPRRSPPGHNGPPAAYPASAAAHMENKRRTECLAPGGPAQRQSRPDRGGRQAGTLPKPAVDDNDHGGKQKKRQALRGALEGRHGVQCGGKKPIFHTLTHDLSINGTAVQSATDEKQNTVVNLLLIPPAINGVQQKVLKLRGVVVSSRPLRSGFRLGFNFVHDAELEKLWHILNGLDLSGDRLPSDPDAAGTAPPEAQCGHASVDRGIANPASPRFAARSCRQPRRHGQRARHDQATHNGQEKGRRAAGHHPGRTAANALPAHQRHAHGCLQVPLRPDRQPERAQAAVCRQLRAGERSRDQRAQLEGRRAHRLHLALVRDRRESVSPAVGQLRPRQPRAP